jgi:hypothetical protein
MRSWFPEIAKSPNPEIPKSLCPFFAGTWDFSFVVKQVSLLPQNVFLF